MTALPPAAEALAGFARLLRQAGFPVSPEQNGSFLHAVQLLGPRGMHDIRTAAIATMAPPPDRRADFDALFRGYFWGDTAIASEGEDDDEIRDDLPGGEDRPMETRTEEGGALTSAAERFAARSFPAASDDLTRFRRALISALPTRHALRHRPSRNGRPDLRRSLREVIRADGDIPVPPFRKRPHIPRRILLLIDVSGSMKPHTADYLRLAHSVVQSARDTEVFTLGTRLSRITPSLRLKDRTRALQRAAEVVEDWDGGTRLGPTLLSFLSLPRFAALARGAVVLILSDGLERGDPAQLITAIRRLAARAHRLSLCTPLAADPRYRPETAALAAILPLLDDLVDGSPPALPGFILSLARPAPSARDIWRKVS